MNNDLSKVKVGDWIWSIKYGWRKVISIDNHSSYPIGIEQESFAVDGREYPEDAAPSAFTEPPECFNADPKPCEFVKGQRVLVSERKIGWIRSYFSHEEDGIFFCFKGGSTEWSSDGETNPWKFCISAEEV